MAQSLDLFRYPLDSSVVYVSPFGSLRDNHFHSGADLSTQQQEGKIVYAASSGYISRIKVQSGGYGKAIYIDHPNGYTTVYGHLQSYYGPAAQWIQNYQYQHKTFEFDHVFPKPLLWVQTGDTIGISGNSGSSTGPHLHFEIRNTKTEEILNIADFGIIPFDTIKPFIESLHFYQFVPDGLWPVKKVNLNDAEFLKSDSLWLYFDTIFLPAQFYGLGMVAWDKINNVNELKYPTSYRLQINHEPAFEFRLNQFSFDKTKYINTHIDYPLYRTKGARVQKVFLDDGNLIKLYKYNKNKGKFWVEPNKTLILTIEVSDQNNNTQCYKFNIIGTETKEDEQKENYINNLNKTLVYYPGIKYNFNKNNFKVFMPTDALYDTTSITFETEPSPKYSFSDVFKFNHYYQPVHAAFDVSIKTDVKAENYANKLVIAYTPDKVNSYRSIGGTYHDGWITAKASSFGKFFLLADTTAPLIEQLFINKNKNVNDSLSRYFKISDNLSGIATYNGYINNQWVLLDYDAKNNLLTYTLDEVYYKTIAEESLSMQKPTLKLIVTDKKGNSTEKTFNLN